MGEHRCRFYRGFARVNFGSHKQKQRGKKFPRRRFAIQKLFAGNKFFNLEALGDNFAPLRDS